MLALSESEYRAITGKTHKKESNCDLSRTSFQSMTTGRAFEDLILLQCAEYKKQGKAVIDKTPEPFLVLHKERDGLFSGRFVKGNKAQPDFQGTLFGGRSVVIEAKCTSKDRIRQEVLTPTQRELLAQHEKAGALSLVVCGIGDRYFSVPFSVWEQMKEKFGHKYATADELKEWEIKGKILPFL